MAIAMPSKTFQPPVKGALPEHLIYANTAEEKLLKALGGAGVQTKSGVPSFYTVRNQNTGGQSEGSVTGYSSAPNSSVATVRNQTTGGQSQGSVTGYSSGSSGYSSRNDSSGSDSASSRKSNDGTNFSYNSPTNANSRNAGFPLASAPIAANNSQSILGRYGVAAPQATDGQPISQIKPINFQVSQAVDPARMTVDMVGNVPYFNGPHPQNIGFASQVSPADMAANYAAYRSPPGQPQSQSQPPAAASSWLGDNTQAQPVAATYSGPKGTTALNTAAYEAGGMTPLASGITSSAHALGISPQDLGTAISYETGGTFDPSKLGPTTQWGQHKGLIQFGEPQAKQFGVDWQNPLASQLGPDGAVVQYMKAAGVQPGMGMKDVYSAINAGQVGRYNASDANNGGAPGTVADKVNYQMAGHAAKAANVLGGTQAPPTQIASAAPAQNGSPTSLYNPTVQQPFNWASLDNGMGGQTLVAANDQTQPQPIYNAETITPPAGAMAPTSTVDKLLGAASPRLGPGQTTDVPLQIASSLPGALGPIAKFLGTPRNAPTGGPIMTANNEGFGMGQAVNSQMPIASSALPAQSNPQQVQDLVAQLQTTTDPVKHAQILAMLRDLDPNTIRYGLQMRQNA